MPLSSFRGTAQLRDDVRTNEDAASRSTRQPTDAPIGQFETIETGRLNRFRLNFGSFHKALFPTAQATFFASSDRRKTPPPPRTNECGLRQRKGDEQLLLPPAGGQLKRGKMRIELLEPVTMGSRTGRQSSWASGSELRETCLSENVQKIYLSNGHFKQIKTSRLI